MLVVVALFMLMENVANFGWPLSMVPLFHTGGQKGSKNQKSLEFATANGAQAFQTPRKDRENFRKALVDIIV